MEESKKYLIVGLGNAENQYAGTRHNIGFEVATAFAESLGATFQSGRYAYVAQTRFKGKQVTIIMPTTYMNLSGKAVRYWLDNEKIAVENMLVITDDIDLPPGTLRLRLKGGGGSHNGLNHIIETLGHRNFSRLRFGIGKNYAYGYQVDYVLGKFEKKEFNELILPAINKAVDITKAFIATGVQRAMNQCNAGDEDPLQEIPPEKIPDH